MASQKRRADDDYSECCSYSQSQGGTQAFAALSADEVHRMVSNVVYYMLISDQKKMPIKRTDINKMVLREHSRAFNRIFQEAQKQLKEVFGIKVVELDGKRKWQYLLLNDLDINPETPHVCACDDAENQRMGLLTIVLSLIFMNGNRISENLFWQALKKIGLHNDRSHEVFGDVQKLLTKDFVRQLYLDYTQVPDSEPPVYEFAWGSRAKLEISKMDLLGVVCQIYGTTKPEQWLTQFDDASQADI